MKALPEPVQVVEASSELIQVVGGLAGACLGRRGFSGVRAGRRGVVGVRTGRQRASSDSCRPPTVRVDVFLACKNSFY